MNGADTCAGLHRNDRFRNHRHVNDDPVACDYTQRLQPIGESADLGVQIAITEPPDITRFAFENNRRFVTMFSQVYIQAVVRNVEFAVTEPAIVRCIAFVEDNLERLVPVQVFPRQVRPEFLRVFLGLSA